MHEHVCWRVSVRLSASISPELYVQYLTDVLCMLSMAVARICCDGVALRCELPV